MTTAAKPAAPAAAGRVAGETASPGREPAPPRRGASWELVALTLVGGLTLGALAAAATADHWRPWLASVAPARSGPPDDEAGDYPDSLPVAVSAATNVPDDHGHSHGDDPSHDEHDANMLALSGAARKNVGVRLMTLRLKPYERTITIPGVIVERPGRTRIDVPAPLSGVVTKIHRVVGEAITPGEPLFELRLRDDALVSAQAEYLLAMEQLAVVQQELKRLASVGSDVVARKQVLEREYEQRMQQAKIESLRQRLLLEGLTDEQLARIKQSGELLQTVTVYAPTHPGHVEGDEATRPAHLQSLAAAVGQRVVAGESLGVLADHSELFVEGAAFEGDSPQLVRAATEGWPLSVQIGGEPEPIDDLKMLYSADVIDRETRAARFYVALPNTLRARPAADGEPRYVDWRFKPGRRVEVLVPVERLQNQLVVPADAVAREGAETFVFVEHTDDHGEHFDRVAVHVVLQDGRQAVLAQGGRLKPGDVIVAGGAYQMHLALKNAAGGGVDPHAGHTH